MNQIITKIQEICILIPPMLLAITLHELAHGMMAEKLGDPTPRLYGRLTLNPIKHLDFLGTVVFLVTGLIGWAKPVPVNASYFKRPMRDMCWVGIAGPLANLFVALCLAVVYRLVKGLILSGAFLFLKPLYLMLQLGVVLNLALAFFNLLPIPPLDGSHILKALLPLKYAILFRRMEVYGVLFLIIFIYIGGLRYTIVPPLYFLLDILLG